MPNCDPELVTWMEPKWLEDNTEEPCGLWHGNVEGWVQSLSCHKDLWADMSQVHTGPPVMWAIAALLISSLIADLCYSCSFSAFFVFLFPTVSVLRLGILLGSAVHAKEAFLTKVLSRLANRSSRCLGGLMTFEISNQPVWTQEVQLIQIYLVWLSKTITWGLPSAHYCSNLENY